MDNLISLALAAQVSAWRTRESIASRAARVEETATGKHLRAWLQREKIRAQIGMEADNFDLLINLVSLGLGVSLVPHRALALHPTTRPVQRIIVKPKFTRELLVITRQQKTTPTVIGDFTRSILF